MLREEGDKWKRTVGMTLSVTKPCFYEFPVIFRTIASNPAKQSYKIV